MVETLPQVFLNTVNAYPKDGLLLSKKEGSYVPISTRQFGDAVKDLCLGLNSLGFRAGDKLCLLSENRPEWVMADLATLCAGGLTVPIYTTLVTDQIGYIIDDSDATVVIVSNATLWKKVEPLKAQLTKVRHYIMIDGPAPAGILSFAELMEKGRALAAAIPGLFGDLAARVRADDPA
jgi:long-chain acyl-CoA synthetase